MDPNENNNHYILTPLPGDQTNILMNPACRRPNEEMNRRFVSEEIHVREELSQRSHYSLLPSRVLAYPNMQPQYGLRFINKVKDPTYTTKPVRDNNGDQIRVEIYNFNNRSRVSPDCFLSSAKVRISVLDADFWKDRVNWRRSEFVQNVLRGREGKEPILIGGSLTIWLENGVGTFGNIFFNDNSSWTKLGFRLGVMVEGDRQEGYWNGERVQEGVSEPFRVRDRRTEASKKLDFLKPIHDVKSIKKIGKGRASLLQKININTVEDFCKLLHTDEAALRETLGIKSESGKEWVSMVEHVKQCADQFDPKYNDSNNSSQPRQALVPLMERNMPLSTNGGCPVVGLGSSEPNHSENDRIEAINRQSSPNWDHGHTWNNVTFEPFLSDSFFNGNGNSMQPTNGDGFPHLQVDSFISSDNGNYDSGGGDGGGSGGYGGSGSGNYSGGAADGSYGVNSRGNYGGIGSVNYRGSGSGH